MKISAVYKITNAITGDFYIGSSKDVKHRWATHKCKSTCKIHSNNQLYLDMQKYGTNKFVFEILTEVEEDSLKEKEQQFIQTLKPSYNNRNANGCDIERIKKSRRKSHKEYNNQLCNYNGETLTLCALSTRFRRKGINNPTTEAKKHLL